MSERICLLTDQKIDDLPLPKGDWPCDPRPYLPEAEWTLLTLEKATAVASVIKTIRDGHDVFFNLCDGAWDEGRVGIEVVKTLEAHNVAFTGADSDFFEPSREAMKRVCRAWGLDTPNYVFARVPRDLEEALDVLRFPMFVKHPSSYASSGLTRASVVTNAAELAEQAGIMMEKYGWALIEEFITGTECTVLVAENAADPRVPIVYRPIEYRFPEGESFKHAHLKWVDYGGLTSFPVEDPALDALLREATGDFFVGMRGAGYGRCDFRVDAEGRAHILEINPLCGVFYPPTDPGSADLVLSVDPAGHVGFTRAVVDAALARHRRRQRPWQIRPRLSGDYATYASRSLSAGERIVAFEEQAHHLVTRAHVERHWDARRLDWFARYAWPLTDEVFVSWSEDPEDWRPVNHSCDPNAWLEGLDVVARRTIAVGDEITLDYATFYDEGMPTFSCECGESACRGIVRGDDYEKDFAARYEGHMSDHVARRRVAARR